jgi:enoyl-[acyl-carrier protein] reductase I
MLLKGKKALIAGVANNKSIAYGIAKAFKNHGAELALSWPGEAIRKRVDPLAEELGASFTLPCDVTQDADLKNAAKEVAKHWDQVDILVHAVAFAQREDLQGRFLDTSRRGFALALDVSAFSLVGLCKAFEPLFAPDASVIAMTYYGGQKVIPNYNVMGIAKAALESAVRYLAYDLGAKGVRINAISAGPVKTLAASGIGGFHHVLSHIEDYSPLRRNVTIDDVGNAALYLASPLAAGQTGDVIFVDCGFNVSGAQIRLSDEAQ